MTYKTNKGVGKSFEFKGLRTTYVFMALGGIVLSILFYFILGLLLPFAVTLIIVILIALGSIGLAYYMNAHFGESGLKYAIAQIKTIQRIQMDKRIYKIVIVK